MIKNNIFLICLILIINIISFDKDKDKYNTNNYDFINIINNWTVIYDKYSFSGYKLKELNRKIIAPKIMNSIGIKTPKIYYYGNIQKVNKNIFNKKAYIIKPERGHTSMNVYLMYNGINLFDGKKYNYNDFEKIFNYNQSKYIETLENNNIIIEEFILNYDSKNNYVINDDFKVFTFRGTPELILHKFYENGQYYFSLYNSSGIFIKNITINHNQDLKQKKIDIKYLKKILRVANYIGKKIFKDVFVRLDFYLNHNYEVIFGEVTPRPFGGINYTEQSKKLLNNFTKKHNLYYDYI